MPDEPARPPALMELAALPDRGGLRPVAEPAPPVGWAVHPRGQRGDQNPGRDTGRLLQRQAPATSAGPHAATDPRSLRGDRRGDGGGLAGRAGAGPGATRPPGRGPARALPGPGLLPYRRRRLVLRPGRTVGPAGR